MPFAGLAEFLEALAADGQLARIGAAVDAALEIAEITRRVARASGPALLFEHPTGGSMAAVTNLLGNEARVCRALDIESLDDITARIEALIAKNTPQSWFDRLKIGQDEAGANKYRAKCAKSGPCQQVVRLGSDVALAALPLVKQWPGESGPAITGGQLMTADRGAEHRSVTLCPLQALDQNRLAIIDDGQSAFTAHWANYQNANEKMPAAVVLGGDPAAAVAAQIELPGGVDFDHLTGLLRGRAVDVVKCRSNNLEVPADAELILEGYVDPETPAVRVTSAALRGSHSQIELSAAVLHVTAITHRTHPIVPVTIDTGEHGEASALLKVRERLLLPAVRAIAPGVVDLHLPALGGLHRYAFVSLAKCYPFQARQVASALWGSAALRSTKFLILVDAGVDVRHVESVLAEIGANADPERDVFTYDGPGGGDGSVELLSRHLGIDATTKIAGERSGAAPERLAASVEIEQLVTARWSEYKLP